MSEQTAPIDQPTNGRPCGNGGLVFANYVEEEVMDNEKSKTIKVGLPVRELRANLLAITKGWPRRVHEQIFAQGPDLRPLWIKSTNGLFGWIGSKTDGPIRWAGGNDKVPKPEFDAYLRQQAEAFDAVEPLPHHPLLATHYYMHADVQGGDGRALRMFLDRFRPSTLVDYDLMLAASLTPFWGGAPGQRPAFLIEAEDNEPQGGRGVGKTKFAQAVAHLAGGHIDARPQEDFEKLMKRLLSPLALDRRVVLLDNVKTLRFSWADLEALITADIISGYQNYVGEGRRPNTLMWFITLNNASLSKDMAQRCVIIKAKRPPHDPAWEADTRQLIDEYRWEIIGDILAELRRDAPPLKRWSRWSAWEQAVLSRVAEPAECQKVIEERQTKVDGDAEDAELVREWFVAELTKRQHNPETEAIFIPAADAGQIVNTATGEKRPVNKATAYLGTLTILELRRSKFNGARGYAWRGEKSDISKPLLMINSADGWPR